MLKLRAWIQLARPHQYLKNTFIWLPLFFGYKLYDSEAILRTAYAFFVFCLAASGVYVLNDLRDIEEDRQHPVKKFRPLSSGRVDQKEAILFFVFLIALSFFLSSVLLGKEFMAIMGTYLALNLAYSMRLKLMTIVDVVCIAIGFVLRIFAGGIAADVGISHWIVIMTFLMALFLALAKRRDDLILAENGYNARKCLYGYNLEFVSLSMIIMASVIIVSYVLYTVSPQVVEKHGTDQLYLTAFWVILGILRYMQITFVEEQSGSPTLILLKDRFLQTVVILWILSCFLILYVFRN